MNGWVRLWHDMPTDPKWRVIARRSGQPIALVVATFNFVLVNASTNSDRGRVYNLIAEDIAAALDVTDDAINAILDAMQGKVLEGDCLSGWEKRQPKREDSSTERVRELRKRNETQGNAQKRSDTDTDKINLIPIGIVPSDEIRLAVECWNDLAGEHGLAKVQRLTDPRRRSLGQRLRECGGLEGWHDTIAMIPDSPFLLGNNDRGWRADFDFVLQAKSFTKLREGGYGGTGPPAKVDYSKEVTDWLNGHPQDTSECLIPMEALPQAK